MRHCFFETILLILFIRCTSPTSPTTPSAETGKVDTKTPISRDSLRQHVEVIVKDSSRYSARFLKGLKEIGPGTRFELVDSLIITDNEHRNTFNQILTATKETTLTAVKSGKRYILKVRQINLTTISFDFTLTEAGKELTSESGLADLSPQFMLGSESDDDDDGGGYDCSEYHTYEQKCLYSIRIGVNHGKIKGKVKGCSGDLQLDNCPTLKEDNQTQK